jgi:putative cardiolipin synthase
VQTPVVDHSALTRDASETRLAQAVLPLVAAHPRRSGIVPLRNGRDAFGARYHLAEAAEQTLDVQYYIWHHDLSGRLLFDALRRAADRGVRVRLLLDDNNTAGLDTMLAALNAHANIEVRLFNAFKHRRWRWVDYLTDFSRLNRRMHNKSFTADGQVTIVGGRNVGDEYFGAGHDVMFVDLDVLAIGPVVAEVARDFDRYWQSASARSAADVLPSVRADESEHVLGDASRLRDERDSVAYRASVDKQPFVRELLAGSLDFEWAPTLMVSDDPAKGLGRASDDALLFTRIKELFGMPKSELKLISPYFVPGTAGTDYLVRLATSGVAVAVLTNSLEATDVAAVHAGYAKRRAPLLRAGVTLFELKRGAAPAPRRARHAVGGSMGSSGSSLHAKTFTVDGCRVFVGSFNFDPRSSRLNTELGFVIDSPALATEIATAFKERIPSAAYRVRLSENDRLQWEEHRDDENLSHDEEPGTRLWKRLGVSILALLPIEWLL